jgi:hypothetical protein
MAGMAGSVTGATVLPLNYWMLATNLKLAVSNQQVWTASSCAIASNPQTLG